MKKTLLCITILFTSLSFADVNSTQMTQEEMLRRIAELQTIVNNIEYPTQWSDQRFSKYLSEAYVNNYHIFNKEFGDGEKSGFVRERNKVLGFLGKAVESNIGRSYAVHQLREKTDILKSDPHTWAAQGIAEADKHLRIANRLSGLVFETYFQGKPPIVVK